MSGSTESGSDDGTWLVDEVKHLADMGCTRDMVSCRDSVTKKSWITVWGDSWRKPFIS